MLDWLVKKDYLIDLDGKEVKYKQLTIMECLEFNLYSQQEDFDLFKWLDKLFGSELSYKNIDLKKLMQTLYNTAFKWFYSSKKWDPKEITEREKVKSDFEYLAFLVSVSWEIKLDPISILEKYTPEQLTLISKWLSYKINESSKEWKAKNNIMIEWLSTDVWAELDKIQKARERAKKLIEKNKKQV